MKVISKLAVALCLGVLVTGQEAMAQFGGAIQPPRAFEGLGGSAAPARPGGLGTAGGLGTLMESSAESIGQVSAEDRFIRGNRTADDFVGIDSGDRAGFIGAAGADNTGPIQSATTGNLAPKTTTGPAIYRTRVRSPAPYMYEARLRVGFDVSPRSLPEHTTMVARRLMGVRAIDPASSIEVKLAGSTATLAGFVGSDREKRLAGMLLMFEPGISSVKNELVVRPPSTGPPQSPSDAKAPKTGDS